MGRFCCHYPNQLFTESRWRTHSKSDSFVGLVQPRRKRSHLHGLQRRAKSTDMLCRPYLCRGRGVYHLLRKTIICRLSCAQRIRSPKFSTWQLLLGVRSWNEWSKLQPEESNSGKVRVRLPDNFSSETWQTRIGFQAVRICQNIFG